MPINENNAVFVVAGKKRQLYFSRVMAVALDEARLAMTGLTDALSDSMRRMSEVFNDDLRILSVSVEDYRKRYAVIERAIAEEIKIDCWVDLVARVEAWVQTVKVGTGK